MYNLALLKEEFVSLVGISQPNVPGVPKVVEPLSLSLSGIYSNSKNPLVETENVFYSAPNFSPSVYPLWKLNAAYELGFVVSYDRIIYIAKANITDSLFPPPDAYPGQWDVYNPFNEWLLKKYDNAISNLFSEIVRRKKMLGMSKAILESQQLYKSFASNRRPIIKSGRFLAFQFFNQPAEGLIVLLNKVGFQATLEQSGLKFYLYHSDKLDKEGEWNFSSSSPMTFSWFDLKNIFEVENCIMEYMRNNSAGSYLFGYYEDDVNGNALSKEWDPSVVPCVTCNSDDIYFYNRWSRHTTIRPLSIPAAGLNTERTLPNLSMANYNDYNNWGMNIALTVKCDLTRFFIANKFQIADAFAMQICKEFLETIAKGIRLGPDPAQTKLAALADLDRSAPANWIKSYDDSIDALSLDFSGFNKSCMPQDSSKKMKKFVI
jgi:hypothetical protein